MLWKFFKIVIANHVIGNVVEGAAVTTEYIPVTHDKGFWAITAIAVLFGIIYMLPKIGQGTIDSAVGYPMALIDYKIQRIREVSFEWFLLFVRWMVN